jgi:hypothetical protein
MAFDRAPESRLDGLAFAFEGAVARNADSCPVASKNFRNR